MAKDPQKIAAKWARNIGQAGQDMKDGADAVTESPTAAAARNKQGYINGVMEAVNSGKWERGLAAVSTVDWQNAYKNIGVPRIQQGATAKQPKVAAFHSELQPFQQALRARIKSMPNATREDRKARMNAWVDGMAQFKRSGR